MSSKRQKTAGFTLIELLIYLSLVSGILIAATSFAWTIINSRTKAFAVQEVEQNGRFITERLTQAIRQAQDVTTPHTGEVSNSLSLIMRDSPLNPTEFTSQNNQVLFSQGGSPPVALNSSQVMVKNLDFYNLSTANGRSHHVRIVLELEHRNPDQRQEWQASDTFATTVELRDTY